MGNSSGILIISHFWIHMDMSVQKEGYKGVDTTSTKKKQFVLNAIKASLLIIIFYHNLL